jgi:hypothetical protein
VQGYHLGNSWKGFPRYCCDYCPYDSLVEVRLREHVIEVHQFALIASQQVTMKKLDVTLYDSSGDTIVEREVFDGEDNISRSSSSG